ncbi:cation-translocating P-type ATPase [Marinobacter salicampi]|uniref:cation-translocating P-type ATPase n=1 Tax=Marinobacter salicampi TaxID=435907 RepID=UPI00140CDC52|nr:HAD-IC family P-type ATPase [Marinobacter salicampi]
MKASNGRPSETVEARQWHALDVDAARQSLDARAPLSAAEAGDRLNRFGVNKLPEAASRGPLKRLAAQLRNTLIYVLLSAALVTAVLGHWVDTVVILAVVALQTLIGFFQEGRAEHALAAIGHMLAPTATVVRSEGQTRVPAAQLVPGDTVILEAGDRVPADMRLERCHGLNIDESALTGESLAVEKSISSQPESAIIGDQYSMAFAGTLVTSGTARAIVVRTGIHTELGRISGMLRQTVSLKTPLIAQVDKFARYLSLVILVVALAIFVVGSVVGAMPLADLFMAVVGLTVAAIPEGLPAVLTITLAIGVRRMAARQAVVRRMPVIESIGAVSVVCSDKTGTLTRNEMMVTKAFAGGQTLEVTGEGYGLAGSIKDTEVTGPCLEQLARAAMLCNDAVLVRRDTEVEVQGDPMEGALKLFGHKAGLDIESFSRQWPRLDEVPFDTAYRFMATLNHDHHGNKMVYLKGAPERVIAMCDTVMGDSGPEPLDADAVHKVVDILAADGLRVLAFARQPHAGQVTVLDIGSLQQGLELIGLVGMMDPPRQEAIKAIADCHSAGIDVKMITGDHALTASAIAVRLGLKHTARVVTGAELDTLGATDLVALLDEVDVFARTSPEHKLRLVEAIQARRGVVAMTGDGVNDAPALKRADVGIAMGIKGSEAAREAASVVLLDDNFASIAAAVREGRTVYANLKKTIAFILPVNGGESVSLIVALLLGLTLPITALQILWVNMVSSVLLAMTLAFEPPEPGVMSHPPRAKSESLLAPFVIWRVALVSLLFLGGIFAAWYWSMARTGDVETARTLAVNTLVAMEIFYLFAVRYLDSASITLRGVLGTPIVLGAVVCVLAVQLLFTYTPLFNDTFGTRALGLAELGFAAVAGVLLLLILELETFLRTRLRARTA